ncbi:MAG: hypothetical protein ACKO5K_13575 [Armatimonadota bacterium]
MISVVRFEWRLRWRQPATWLYFLVFFLLAFLFVSTDAVQVGGADGPVKATSPLMAARVLAILGALGSVVSAALVGTAIQRDSDAKVADLFATTGIGKAGYFLGRFLGAWLVSIPVFAGLPLGLLVGSFMPWVDPNTIAPFDPRTYLGAFLFLIVPNLLVCGALFFVVGTFTRSLMAVYALGVGLFVLWGVTSSLLGDMENRGIAAMVDPFGLRALGETARYWSVFEQNARPIAPTGWLLANRLFWCGIASGLVVVGLARFSFRTDLRARKAPSARVRVEDAAPAGPSEARPDVVPSWWATARSVARGTHSDMVRGISYKVIVLAGLLLLATNVWMADRVFDNETLLLTSEVLESGFGGFMLFFLILVTVYASEAVWRERTVRIDQIVDALPVASSAVALGKFAALCGMLVRTTLVVAAACVVLQLLKGSPSLDLGMLVRYVAWVTLPQLFLLAAFATFVHTVVDHRFAGHGIVLGLFVLQLVFPAIGWDHVLLQPFTTPQVVLSDMNGFGPFLEPLGWISLTWAALSGVLLTLAALWWVRGRDTGLGGRVRAGRPGRVATAVLTGFGVAFVGGAGWVFVNTNLRHDYRSSKHALADRARYEKTFRALWRDKPQPKVAKVDLDVALFPREGDYVSSGTMTLANRSTEPITDVLIGVDPDANELSVEFEGGVENVFRYPELGVGIHSLKRPIAPGGKALLRFRIGRTRKGFPNAAPPVDVVENGSFLTMPVPTIGYRDDAEIADDSERRRQGLAKKAQMGDPTDPRSRASSYLGRDADWVEFACTVRTEPGQIAVAPGYLDRQWKEAGRDCFRYVMDAPIRHFFTVVSARYAVRRDLWKAPDGREVRLEVYYHPSHGWNVERMMQAMKDTLAACEAAYMPFQYRQMRILEFPKYAQFAQSFPNTVPYSEGIGFVLKHDPDPRALDVAYYVTAHEVAHQWWAHQVVGADAAGSELLSESLADYTALGIATRDLPPSGRRRAAERILDRYLLGRGSDRIGENPLVRVQHQDYIHYSKGSLVLGALADRVGAKVLDEAIARFARLHRFGAAPYPTGEDFVAHLESALPSEKAWISDQFRRIRLVDFRIEGARKQRLPSGRWRVEATVRVDSREAAPGGEERERPFADRVVFWGTGPADRRGYCGDPIATPSIRMVSGANRIVFDCDREPAELLVDPLVRWIGSRPGDRSKKL